jgi:hypothetical protein
MGETVSDQWRVEVTDLASLQRWSRAAPRSRVEVLSHRRRFGSRVLWSRDDRGRSVGLIGSSATRGDSLPYHDEAIQEPYALEKGVPPGHAASDTTSDAERFRMKRVPGRQEPLLPAAATVR